MDVSVDIDVGAVAGESDESEEDSANESSEEEKAASRKVVMEDYRKKSQELYSKRREIVRDEHTGYVWVLYQK